MSSEEDVSSGQDHFAQRCAEMKACMGARTQKVITTMLLASEGLAVDCVKHLTCPLVSAHGADLPVGLPDDLVHMPSHAVDCTSRALRTEHISGLDGHRSFQAAGTARAVARPN